MGCCLSTTTKSPEAENHHNPSVGSCKRGGARPQPPPLEVETVKEVVLSETPVQQKPSTINVEEKVRRNESKEDCEVRELRSESTGLIKHPAVESTAVVRSRDESEIVSEVSEYSEMCSFTESLSAATAPEKRDDDGEVTQRSPARMPRKRQNTGEGKGPRRKAVSSPGRRPAPERRGQVTTSRAPQERQVNAQRRNVGLVKNPRRDSGEGPARRSRSPVTRGGAGPRQDGRRNGLELHENGRVEMRSPERTVDNSGEKEGKINDVVVSESGETLENPVVSLECFIFL